MKLIAADLRGVLKNRATELNAVQRTAAALLVARGTSRSLNKNLATRAVGSKAFLSISKKTLELSTITSVSFAGGSVSTSRSAEKRRPRLEGGPVRDYKNLPRPSQSCLRDSLARLLRNKAKDCVRGMRRVRLYVAACRGGFCSQSDVLITEANPGGHPKTDFCDRCFAFHLP